MQLSFEAQQTRYRYQEESQKLSVDKLCLHLNTGCGLRTLLCVFSRGGEAAQAPCALHVTGDADKEMTCERLFVTSGCITSYPKLSNREQHTPIISQFLWVRPPGKGACFRGPSLGRSLRLQIIGPGWLL